MLLSFSAIKASSRLLADTLDLISPGLPVANTWPAFMATSQSN
jgi:hypothetical protein